MISRLRNKMNEDQVMEWEVLESIYSIDENYKKLSDTKLQYKFGTDSERTFLVEIEWPPEYPLVVPNINMDVFYNSHISVRARRGMRDKLLEVAKENEGMAVSFTLIEYAKEKIDELTSDWEAAAADAIGELRLDDDVKDKKDEHLTKRAKQRMWARNEGGGGERGFDWVDIIKHLSQIKDN